MGARSCAQRASPSGCSRRSATMHQPEAVGLFPAPSTPQSRRDRCRPSSGRVDPAGPREERAAGSVEHAPAGGERDPWPPLPPAPSPVPDAPRPGPWRIGMDVTTRPCSPAHSGGARRRPEPRDSRKERAVVEQLVGSPGLQALPHGVAGFIVPVLDRPRGVVRGRRRGLRSSQMQIGGDPRLVDQLHRPHKTTKGPPKRAPSVRFRRNETYSFFGGLGRGLLRRGRRRRCNGRAADATAVAGGSRGRAAAEAAVVAVVAAAEAEAAAEFAVPAMSVVADAAAADGSVGGVTGSMLDSLFPPPQAAARAKGAKTKYLRMPMGVLSESRVLSPHPQASAIKSCHRSATFRCEWIYPPAFLKNAPKTSQIATSVRLLRGGSIARYKANP